MKIFRTLLKIAKPTITIVPQHRSTLPITAPIRIVKKTLINSKNGIPEQTFVLKIKNKHSYLWRFHHGDEL